MAWFLQMILEKEKTMWLFEIIEEILSMFGLTCLFSLGVIGWILIGIIYIISFFTIVVLAWFVLSLIWAWTKRTYWFISRKEEPFECEMLGWKWIEKWLYH